MISALLINLHGSTNRFTFQRQQFTKLNLQMKRLNAIGSNDILDDEYEILANSWERKLSMAEVACFLSHKMAWQYVADTKKPWLIMEDDALLSQEVPEILKNLDNLRDNIDYVTLETRYRRKWLGKSFKHLTQDYQLRRLYQDRSGAAAYVLFPSGAEKLLKKTERSAVALADAFLCSSYELESWQVYPAAAIQLDQCHNYELNFDNPFSSTITPVDFSLPKANSFVDYCTFKARRIVSQLRMGLRQLAVNKYSERVLVPIKKQDFELNLDLNFISNKS